MEGDTPVWWDGEDRIRRLGDYCKQDVRTERAIKKLTLRLRPSEREMYLLDQEINDLGVAVDVDGRTQIIEYSDLLKRPVGCPPHHVRRYYANFRYRAASWDMSRRVVAKVEWHPGELYPRVGFIVTNMSRPAERVAPFYNKRGTCEQWIKEGKNTIMWTRLSCCAFAANAVRLQLHALAYTLANFMRTLALRKAKANVVGVIEMVPEQACISNAPMSLASPPTAEGMLGWLIGRVLLRWSTVMPEWAAPLSITGLPFNGG